MPSVLYAQNRLGSVIFRDMLGLHFSSARLVEDELAQHPLAEFLLDVIGRAQARDEIASTSDAPELATGAALFGDEPEVAARIELLYSEMLIDEIGRRLLRLALHRSRAGGGAGAAAKVV